ncbi:hypothetical protein BCV70DRAFT_25450 [Testicularia cyperi]|uniref:Uncharacterized protein n=1 Tax=Testicularia cyperi TaxID=1882483 RepID=A0A317XLG9_9BASI|nr:hypothetical protein BCV70DRAFT_25450 [Testicularia cyperi]
MGSADPKCPMQLNSDGLSSKRRQRTLTHLLAFTLLLASCLSPASMHATVARPGRPKLAEHRTIRHGTADPTVMPGKRPVRLDGCGHCPVLSRSEMASPFVFALSGFRGRPAKDFNCKHDRDGSLSRLFCWSSHLSGVRRESNQSSPSNACLPLNCIAWLLGSALANILCAVPCSLSKRPVSSTCADCSATVSGRVLG